MPNKTARLNFHHWLLTPAEITVLAMAATVIWIAKWQDRTFAEATRRSTRSIPVSAYIPTNKHSQNPEKQAIEPAQADSTNLPTAAPTLLDRHLSEDEKRFLRRFTEQQKLRFPGGKLTPKQWETLLKNASVTYAGVADAFETATGRSAQSLIAAEVLENPAQAERIFSALQQRYSISPTAIRNFASGGRRSLADWAFFVEQRQGQ